MHSYLDAFQYQSRLYPPSKNMLSVALFALAPLTPLTPLLSCILKLISTLACNYDLLFTEMEQVQTSGPFNTEVMPTQYAVYISLYINM